MLLLLLLLLLLLRWQMGFFAFVVPSVWTSVPCHPPCPPPLPKCPCIHHVSDLNLLLTTTCPSIPPPHLAPPAPRSCPVVWAPWPASTSTPQAM
jgi:hypothetical protein